MRRFVGFLKNYGTFLLCIPSVVIILFCLRFIWWYNPVGIPSGQYTCLRNVGDDFFREGFERQHGDDGIVAFGRYYEHGIFVGYWYGYQYKLHDYTPDDYFEEHPDKRPGDWSDVIYLALDFTNYDLNESDVYPVPVLLDGPYEPSWFDKFFGELFGGGVCLPKAYADSLSYPTHDCDLGW